MPAPLVLVNAIHSKTGGGRVYLEEVVPRVARLAGARYVVLARGTQAPRLRELGAETHVVSAPDNPAGAFAWDQTVLVALAWRLAADLVFTPANFGPIALGRRSLLLLRNTFEAAESWPGLRARIRWRAMEFFSRASVRAAKGALVVSDSFRSEVARRFCVPADSLCVVHHGRSDRFRPNPDPKDAAIAPRDRYVVVVGDIYPHKNLETVIDAFARLAPRHADLALVFAGAEVDEAYAARMRGRAADLGLARRVTFAGPRSQTELPAFYRRAVCALSLSLAETFGITQVEALACGTPLVASDIAVTREISGDAAVLVPPRDPDAVAAAVERVLTDSAWRAELGRRAILRAAAFTWDRTAARLHEEVLRRISDLAPGAIGIQ